MIVINTLIKKVIIDLKGLKKDRKLRNPEFFLKKKTPAKMLLF